MTGMCVACEGHLWLEGSTSHGLINTCKNINFPQLRLGAVITLELV